MIEGSWKWAVREFRKGYVLTRKSVTGTLKYKIDTLMNGRILKTWDKCIDKYTEWENQSMFLSELEATDWIHAKRTVCKLKKK